MLGFDLGSSCLCRMFQADTVPAILEHLQCSRGDDQLTLRCMMMGQICILTERNLVGQSLLCSFTLQLLRQESAACGMITVEIEDI